MKKWPALAVILDNILFSGDLAEEGKKKHELLLWVNPPSNN